VTAGQTVTELNFGVAGDDRKPKVFVRSEPEDVRAGDTLTASVTATDDVGLAAVSLMANSLPVPLDAQGRGQVAVLKGGLLTLVGTATDTANQSAETLHSLIARNADGSLPDLSGLSVGGGPTAEGPFLQVHSPVAGEILSAAREVVGTIRETSAELASWQVHFAPADQVNPRALDAPDPDYILLAEGTNSAFQAPLGRLEGSSLPAGAYLLRIAATDVHGVTAYLGFVFGVRIDPLDLRPEIILTSPTNESTITYLSEVRGSIQTRQRLQEWSVEFAPLSGVDLQNLAAPGVDWVRIAAGTTTVTNAFLATFDPTLLPNDSYVLRVSAWNENGLGWTEPLVVQVSGEAKLGNFAVEFTDLELPLAGIPITLKRVYDSLRAARSGDFGYGWTLALQDADLAETIPQTGSGFASTPFRVGTRVYLTAPDGKRVGFTFDPEFGAGSLLGAVYRAVFRPDPGVRFTLSVPEGNSPFLRLDSVGTASLFFLGLPWNPDTYVLTDPTGTRFTYDQQDGLIEIRDSSDNRVSFSREAIVHSAGQRIELTRDASERIVAVLAPDGRIWRYQYDGLGDLVKVTYPDGSVANLGYGAARPHFLETISDPWHGPSYRTEYDETGRVSALIDAAGNRQEQHWDPGTFSGTHSDARGNVTRLTYDLRGNVIRSEDPLGGMTAWEFKDPTNPDRPTARVDPRGQRTTHRFNATGQVLDEIRPLAHFRHTYDDRQNLIGLVHGTGGSETFTYDDRGKLLSVRSQAGDISFTHTASGLLASLMDGKGGLTRLEYDGAQKLPSRIILPDATVKQFACDAVGHLVQYTDPSGGVTRQEYDSAGRLIRIAHPDGTETRTTYDPVFPERPISVTDRLGRITRSSYDALGRLVEVTAPGNAISRFGYDANGNRTVLVDPLGQRYEFRYDALNRLTEEVDPEGRSRLHEYDAAGNRTATTDRNGRRRAFTYDAQNRLQEERWLNADASLLRTIAHTYDRADQLTTVNDPHVNLSLGRMFVPNGPLLSEDVRYTGAPERRSAFDYDAAIRRSGVKVTTTSPTLEPAVSIRFTRDLAGRLRILSSSDLLPPSKLKGLDFQLQFWRTPRGDVSELRRFADSRGTKPVSQSLLDYRDPCGCRLDRIEHIVATNQPLPEAAQAFSRNAAGQVTSTIEGPTETAYGYDAAGQLTSVKRNGIPVESYAYDVNGNRQSSHRHASYTIGSGNRLRQGGDWTLAYDFEGNLVTKSNTVSGVVLSLFWDYRNRLTRVERQNPGDSAPLVTDYRYDPFNRRIAVTKEGHTTWTYYDGGQPLVDFVDDESTPTAIQFAGEKLDELYAVWRREKGLFWVLTDPLGTPRRLLDTNGVPVAALEFDSFGNPLTASGIEPEAAGRFGFTGREWDPVTGFYFYRARYYDPELGRFLSEDPLQFAAGDSNLYRYVFNQPNTLTDPTGMVTAVEYAHLVLAVSCPGKFCRFAVCVNGLWSGVANAVINLVPAGPPDATCAAKLLGVPATPKGAAVALAGSSVGLGVAIYNSATGQQTIANPVLGTVIDLAACAYEASR